MATQAKIIIKGQNNISDATKSASKDLSALSDTAKKIGSAIKTSLTLTAVIASVKALGNACKTVLTEDFGEANRSYKQLALALKDKTAYDSVVDNIDRLSKKTRASNNDIEAMAAELAALGKNSDEINKISEAAVHLSNVTGKDLSSSMTTLLNTYNGNTAQLKKLGINLEGVTAEELKQGAAVDEVIKKLGAYSDEMAKADASQSLKNMSETWGDIKEKIGGIIDYNFTPFLSNLDTAFSNIGERINEITLYIGAIIKNLPEVFIITMSTLWAIVKRTFEWDSIKTIFTTAIEMIGKVAVAALKAVFLTIPDMLWAMVSGIFQWISYIAMNLQASFLGAIENVINTAGEKIQGTWVGKLFGLGDKLSSFDLGSERIREESKEKKAKADDAFASVGSMLKNAVSDAVALASNLAKDGKGAISDIYGDIGRDFKNTVDELISPDLDGIRAHMNASNQDALLNQISSDVEDGTESTDAIKNNTDSIAKSYKNLSTQMSEKLAEKISALLPDKGESKSGFKAMISDDFKAGIGDLVSAIMPLINIVMQFVSPLSLLLIVVKGFVSVMEPALSTVVQPLLDTLTWLGETIGALFLPVLDQLFVYMSLIGNLLQAVIAPVLQILAPVFQVIGALLEALSPILILVAKAFTIVAAPIQFVADLLSWLGDWIAYCGHAVATFCYNLVHPFSQRSYGSSPGGFSSDAFSGLSDRLAAIDNIGTNDSAATDSVSTGTAISSSQYAGATHITINIYQQAPVVGDGGMRAFARMIKSEFMALDYYGVN